MTQTLNPCAPSHAVPPMAPPQVDLMPDHGSADGLVWDREFEEVQYHARHQGREFLCRIAPTWFSDGDGTLVSGEDHLAAAQSRYATITNEIDERIMVGLFEHDGSVRLRL